MFEDQQDQKPGGVEDIFSATDKTPAAVPPASPPPGPPSALSQGKLQPVGSSVPAMPLAQISGNVGTGFPFKKAIALSVVSLVVVGGAGAAWWWWQTRGQTPVAPPAQGSPTVNPATPAGGQAAPAEPANTVDSKLQETFDNAQNRAINRALDPLGASQPATDRAAPAAPVFQPGGAGAAVDTDGDGLNDAEELTLGTNARLVDTDGDGLADWEEVKIFTTNPLQADTDGDTYSDGLEVQNGYNPKGAGKLLDFEQAKKNVQ